MAQDIHRSTTSKIPNSHRVEEQIRRRAYEIYETRGREDGHELEDWLNAEQELATKNSRTAAA